MAFDGITVSALTRELSSALTNGKISKITQPEKDELILTIRCGGNNYKLLLSADASLPLAYLNAPSKVSPITAPNFCMLLRKYIANGKILRVYQPGLERSIHFEIEHFNEMKDIVRKTLILELMGKHSNIIFVNEDGIILDSIKHIPSSISSVREVLPGREYFLPDTQNKISPINLGFDDFRAALVTMPGTISKALYQKFTGLSPIVGEEIVYNAKLSPQKSPDSLSYEEWSDLYSAFRNIMSAVEGGDFTLHIYYEGGVPRDFSCIPLEVYRANERKSYDSVSAMLKEYYEQKEVITRIRQKSSDLRRIVSTAIERNVKKLNIQTSQLKSTSKRETYKIYGELLSAYSYQIEPRSRSCEVLNYYNNEMITIPLDDTLTPIENANHYFDRYNKLKRTFEAVTFQLKETEAELNYLRSVACSIDIAREESDLTEIRQELRRAGVIRSGSNDRKVSQKSRPLHYISSDGFDIFVGKNNLQNEELSFKVASGNDWWFHAKQMPGSHVIVKVGNKELPDRTFEEAARLAAFYSYGKNSEKVEIDYLQRKHLKKPNGSKPGFVIYHTNYSMLVPTDITKIQQA